MSEVWIAVGLVSVAIAVIRASGPVLLGRRELPARLGSVIGLIAPAVLAALVVTATVSEGSSIELDERLAGVLAAAAAIAARAPLIAVVAVAALVTAALRALV